MEDKIRNFKKSLTYFYFKHFSYFNWQYCV